MNPTNQTPHLALPNPPAFDLDPAAPWPVPTAQPVAPMTFKEIVQDWIERRLA